MEHYFHAQVNGQSIDNFHPILVSGYKLENGVYRVVEYFTTVIRGSYYRTVDERDIMLDAFNRQLDVVAIDQVLNLPIGVCLSTTVYGLSSNNIPRVRYTVTELIASGN